MSKPLARISDKTHSNNNGIGFGVGAEHFDALQKKSALPVGALMPEVRYEKVGFDRAGASSFGRGLIRSVSQPTLLL